MNATPRPQSPVMKPAEVMDVLQISRTAVYLMAHGPLAHAVVRIGAQQRGLRFKRDLFWQWYDSQGQNVEGGR